MIEAIEIGARLRKLRGTMTIDKLSEETGLGRSALTMYELGKRIPRDESKLTLAKYYGLPVDAIFFDPNFTISEK